MLCTNDIKQITFYVSVSLSESKTWAEQVSHLVSSSGAPSPQQTGVPCLFQVYKGQINAAQERKWKDAKKKKNHSAVSTWMKESLDECHSPPPPLTPTPIPCMFPVWFKLRKCFFCWNQALLVNTNWGSPTWLNCRLLWKQAWMERININCIFHG